LSAKSKQKAVKLHIERSAKLLPTDARELRLVGIGTVSATFFRGASFC
jgi:hypothetical protein